MRLKFLCVLIFLLTHFDNFLLSFTNISYKPFYIGMNIEPVYIDYITHFCLISNSVAKG